MELSGLRWPRAWAPPGRWTPFTINYGTDVEPHVAELTELIAATPSLAEYPARWLAIKLLENEPDIVDRVASADGSCDVRPVSGPRPVARPSRPSPRRHSADIAIADARYGYVHGVATEVVDALGRAARYTLTDRLDKVLTNKWVGLPIFLVVMYVVFQLVVNVSAFFLDWVDFVIGGTRLTRWVTGLLTMLSAPDWFISLAVDGVIAGVGAVLVFVPGLHRALPLPDAAGGQRLHGPRGLRHGSRDALHGPAR